jgi:hypothetical protein
MDSELDDTVQQGSDVNDVQDGGVDVQGGDVEEQGGDGEEQRGDVEELDGALPYTERTDLSWADRMQNAFAGVCVGLIFFCGSFAVLIWNEGRAVANQQALQEGIRDVVPLASAFVVDASMTGKLVYTSAELTTNETLVDPVLNVSAKSAIKLRRTVEMFQWDETRRITTDKNGAKKTTYSYSKIWSSSLISSSGFRGNHDNPSQFILDQFYVEAREAMIGAFTVGDEILNQVNWYSPFAQNINVSNIADTSLKYMAKPNGIGGLYFGNSDASPVIGDTRVRIDVASPDVVSIVAMQAQNGQLVPYTTSKGRELLLFRRGYHTSDQMFSLTQSDNERTMWALRFAGFGIMFLGVMLILQPIASFVDIIPFIGNIMQGALSQCIFPLISLIITIPLSLFTIALAWIAYRPIFVIVCAVVSILVALVVGILWNQKRRSDNANEETVDEAPWLVIAEDEPYSVQSPQQDQTPMVEVVDEASDNVKFPHQDQTSVVEDVFVPQVYKP